VSPEGVEQILEGIGVAPGIAIGPVRLYARDTFTVSHHEIDEQEVEAEIARFEQGVSRSERDLKRVAAMAREKLGEGSASIFEAQALMLRDDALYGAVVQRIQNERANADYAVQAVMSRHRQLLNASDSEYLRERANDLLDVQDRIIRHLRRDVFLSDIDPDVIVVAQNLTAADILLFSRRNILGCATDYGGATSHVSIMARSLNVPAVVSLHGATEAVTDGDVVVVDGVHGVVVVNPAPATLDFYRAQQLRYQRFRKDLEPLVDLPAVTRDGRRILLRANLELKEELRLVTLHGAEGIGLFRTEILFLMHGRISFSEEEQFRLYREIVQAVAPDVTTFRVLDLGGDKMLPMAHREPNPFLGWRGIRLLLDKPELLIPQVRAILRASAVGASRILLPMVTNLSEVRRFKELLEQVKAELTESGEAFDADLPVGVMVEVPAVAYMADRFAREVDFLSIGSNDLTQYALAVDRGNDLVSGTYNELHPAVLALIQMTVEAADRHGVPVGICGELAANARVTPILLGMGISELSASPTYLPEIKRVIREIRYDETISLAKAALAARDAEEVESLLETWLVEHACDPERFVATESFKPSASPIIRPSNTEVS
jgi:phosphoenolpyruvate-protein phosphotransferase (PTS system enzyme I)